MEEETYAHELVGQRVIISSVPDQNGKKERPVGYALKVCLLNGLAIQNVTQVDFEPILPNSIIYATLTLAHIDAGMDETKYEQARVEAYIEIPAIVKEEVRESTGHSRTFPDRRSLH